MDRRTEEYLDNIPLLHSWNAGATWNSGGFDRTILSQLIIFLETIAPPQAKIIETGAGNSTIAFLLTRPSRLVSIAPDGPLFRRIKTYCQEKQIPFEPLESVVDGSEWALPKMAIELRDREPVFDFALIDGNHGWPMVMVDFHYCNAMLKRGGHIMLDDVQLHSVKEMARLLAEQPDFRIAADWGKSLVFQRLSDGTFLPEWNSAPYIVRRTGEYASTTNCFAL